MDWQTLTVCQSVPQRSFQEAVGEINNKMETVTDWQDPFKKGTIYYLENGRVRGVLLWNIWDQVDHARTLIAEAEPFQAADLKGRLS
ncbi:MAG: hypothetical protein EHM33_11950 [Chloroflexi bacterium]|nr:MAG: hypothetical protein EHM33_11950 [Chloroflexota bacterium]